MLQEKENIGQYPWSTYMQKKKKNHSKIITSQIQKHIKIMMFYDQVECIPGMEGEFNIYISINEICHINRMSFPKRICKWPTSAWKGAQHDWSSGKCKSKPQWDITSLLWKWVFSKEMR